MIERKKRAILSLAIGTFLGALLLALVLLLSPSSVARSDGDVLTRLRFTSRAQVAAWVAQGVDVWEVRDDYVLAHLSPAQAARLRNAGDVLTEQPLPTGYATYPECYRTYSDTVAFLQTLTDTYPALVTLYDIGDSWEKTQGRANRDLWAVRITNAAIPGPKPSIFVASEHHARELITPEVAMRLASLLTEGFGSDPQATWLLNEREIWLVPMTNPDGHVQAEQHEDWRKNTNTSGDTCSGHSSPNSFGVDLNRNYGYGWGGIGSSTDPCNEVYRGASAFSEPETQAIRDFVTAEHPDILISLHSYSDLILYPWNSTLIAPPDEDGLRALASRMARYNGYTYGQPARLLYPVTGDTTDWAYGTLGIPSYTIEIGGWDDGYFWPSCNRVTPLWEDVRPSLLYAAAVADSPYDRAHGPDVSNIQVVSSTLTGTLGNMQSLTVTAQIYDPDGGAAQVAAAEVSFDRPAPAGTGQPLAAMDGHFDQASELVGGNLSLTSFLQTPHLLFVRGQDQEGHWGPPSAVWVYPANRDYLSYIPFVALPAP